MSRFAHLVNKMFHQIAFLALVYMICSQQLILAMPFSPPGGPSNTVNQPCLLVDNGNVLDQTFPTTYEAAAILLTCSSKQGNVVTHYSGKRSSVSSTIICDNTPLISYDEQTDRPTISAAGMPFECENGLCVFYQAVGNQVLLSALILQDEVQPLQGGARPVPFLRTKLMFGFNGLLQTFAKRVLSAFMQNVSGEIDLRAIAFLATSGSTCSFPQAPCFCQS